jgi:hypothetical protein
MEERDFNDLVADLRRELAQGAPRVGILSLTSAVPRLLSRLTGELHPERVTGVFAPLADPGGDDSGRPAQPVPIRPLADLASTELDVLVVAADSGKEDLLLAALPYLRSTPRVLVAGYGHLTFRDPGFHEALTGLAVPSLANGYPNSLVHLYQCLTNAARVGLSGVVAEFGMFQGGTTMFLARVIERLGVAWPVIGFDTFDGFPARRSPLDMYDHPDCGRTDLDAVRSYLAGHNVEIVAGDIVRTASRLAGENIVVTFVDTDNYTPACAALDVVQDNTVVGGAIVFDHFTGVDRFRYTLGERIAGLRLLDDPRYLHLHGTGVFYRQR